jgi:arabinogalactan endo-1,4-beta-galactosidase
MRRNLIVLITLALVALACEEMPTDTPAPAPTVALAATRDPTPIGSVTPVATERFDVNVEGWHGWAEEGNLSQVTWDPAGQLIWSTETAIGQAVALVREWPSLVEADGLTIRLASLDRFAFLILGVQEADGSSYSVVLPLEAGDAAEHTIAFESFGLQADSDDENEQLDPEQLTMLSLADISGILAAPRPNRVTIDEITLWEGTLDPFDRACTRDGPFTPNPSFRVGVDANYVPQGERHGFWVGEQRVDPLELFATNGANGFRIRLWVGNEGESRLEYATELAHRAQSVDLHPYLVLFLSEDWADVNKQPAPATWAELPPDQRADAIRQYARETTRHLINQGIELDFYEIGNEIDYGICGVFADPTHSRDADSLRNDIWPDEVRLIQAAIKGVREADPEARFLLHIATSWEPSFAIAFFQTMADLGVEYDYVGLSFYPSAFGSPTAGLFCDTLDRLSTEIGKPIVIAETAYPAEPPTGGMFEDWRRPLPGYPLTPEGQAWWTADLLAGMRARGDVLGVYYFSPSFYSSGELWAPFALFDSTGQARPAIASFAIER